MTLYWAGLFLGLVIGLTVGVLIGLVWNLRDGGEG